VSGVGERERGFTQTLHLSPRHQQQQQQLQIQLSSLYSLRGLSRPAKDEQYGATYFETRCILLKNQLYFFCGAILNKLTNSFFYQYANS